MFCGLDLGSRLAGYCYGDGSRAPVAGAFRWPQVGEAFGQLGAFARRDTLWLMERTGVNARWAYEKPIMIGRASRSRRYADTAEKLIKMYTAPVIVELMCHDNDVDLEWVELHDVKRALTGNANAEKDQMVAAAERLGIELPATDADGRKDAADALAVWLWLIQRHAPRDIRDAWDRRLYSAKGAML